MRRVHLFAAGFLLAAALFGATMLLDPPTSRASADPQAIPQASAPIELTGP